VIFSKNKPSPEYLKLLEDYQTIHKEGINNHLPKDTYNGFSTINFADIIKKIINKNNCKTLFDYGSGKGDRYYNKSFLGLKEYPPLKDFWNIEPSLFDPGVPLPRPQKNKMFDISISIDVLEHIPTQDLGWVINEIFEYSKNIVFINVACYPAAKLPNGNNAHISVFDPWWWSGYISAIASNYNKKVFLICTYAKDGQKKFFTYAINDDFKNYG
jgi:hypothetical protein